MGSAGGGAGKAVMAGTGFCSGEEKAVSIWWCTAWCKMWLEMGLVWRGGSLILPGQTCTDNSPCRFQGIGSHFVWRRTLFR